MPAQKAESVVTIVGIIMSEGEDEPYCALRAMTEEGIIWIDAVFTIINMHIARLKVSGWGFMESRAFMALSPRGVAALPMPRRLADMFMLILPMTGEFLYFLPKRSEVRGERSLDMSSVAPLRLAISIIPDQKAIIGARVKKSSKAFSMPLFKSSVTLSPPWVRAV